MCVNIDLGMGKTNEAVPAIIISFDLISAFQGYSFWSVGVVLKRTGGFSWHTGCFLVSGHGWTDCLPTYKSYNRNNDINMQKILTVYCCEVEAVMGGGGLTPSRRSCPLILLISSSKLI